MNPLSFFNSTILVLWVTYVIPKTLREDDRVMLVSTGTIVLALELALCFYWAAQPFPYNLLVAIGIFLFALVGGHVAHNFYQKISKEDT